MLLWLSFLILFSNAVSRIRDKTILYCKVAMVIMVYCITISIIGIDITSETLTVSLFSGLFNYSFFKQIFQILLYTVGLIILLITSYYPVKIIEISDNTTKHIKIPNNKIINNTIYKIISYPLIIIYIIMGASLLMSSTDLVSIFLSIELQSYGLYLLCALHRNSEASTSGSLTYFLLGALSSTFILLGSALIYNNYGTTNIEGLFIINSINSLISMESSLDIPIVLSLLIMSVGLLFKISAAPFHMWSPIVYDSIPTIITVTIAIIAKLSILMVLIYLFECSNNSNNNWNYGIIMSSALSLIIGSILGLTQTRIKKLLAYSTISHIGFILLSISNGSFESKFACIFYIISYTITNLNIFMIIIAIGYTLYGSISKNNIKNYIDYNDSPLQFNNQLQGYYKINIALALSLAITLFSLVGIPPLWGFFAKQFIFSSALEQGMINLVLIAIITSIISAVYYLNFIKKLFFDQCNLDKYKLNNNNNNINNNNNPIICTPINSGLSIIISILTLISLAFIANSQIWLSLVQIMVLYLIDN